MHKLLDGKFDSDDWKTKQTEKEKKLKRDFSQLLNISFLHKNKANPGERWQ